jgi:glycosyltransferase involved in cell wall biosynthesis
MLRRCLEALLRQEFDRSQYEVVVVDDGTGTETRRVVDAFANRGIDLRYIPVAGNHGPAAARNAGLRISRGEIIAFTDDDCIPERQWLRKGTSAFVDGVAGASGRVVVPLPARPSDYELNVSRLQLSQFVTANCFYRRPALLGIGGFDERFRTAWREDSDLLFRLLKEQKRLVEAPEAVVVHPVRPARWGVSILQQKKNVFNALLYKKHPELYRQKLKPVVPWHYYLLVLLLVISLAGIMAGNLFLSAAGAAAWLLGTGAFCTYRLKRSSRTAGHVLEMAVTSIVIPPVCIFWRLVGAIRFRVLFV